MENQKNQIKKSILKNRTYGNLIDPLINQAIQLIIKQFILTWFQAISTTKDPTKQPFIINLQSILIKIIIRLEETFSSLDYQQIILIDLIQTINVHLDLINRIFSFKLINTTRSLPSFDQLFIQHHPHPALQIKSPLSSPPITKNYSIQSDNNHQFITLISPAYLRSSIELILQDLLPNQDWEPETERYIIREIILNAILLPLICQLTQPSFIHLQLIKLLQSDHHPSPSSSSSSSPPSPKHESEHRGFDWRSSWDQVLIYVNNLLQFLLLLPAILGSFIQLITAPTPIPITSTDPRQFEPLIKLLSTLSGTSPQLNQLFWLLGLAVRFSNRLLTKIAIHLIYNHLLSPLAISNFLIKINSILADLDQSKERAKQQPQQSAEQNEYESAGSKDQVAEAERATELESRLDAKEVKTKLESLVSSTIPNQVFKLLRPVQKPSSSLTRSHRPSEEELEREKLEFVHDLFELTINSQAANVALLLEFIDLFVILLSSDRLSSPISKDPLPS